MNTVTAIGSPNSAARAIQNNPIGALDALKMLHKLYCELDCLTGGDYNHPLANWVGHWKSDIEMVITPMGMEVVEEVRRG